MAIANKQGCEFGEKPVQEFSRPTFRQISAPKILVCQDQRFEPGNAAVEKNQTGELISQRQSGSMVAICRQRSFVQDRSKMGVEIGGHNADVFGFDKEVNQ